MSQLATVAEYIAEARVLLQDLDSGEYRYSDVDLTQGLNLGLMEIRRLRPDLFLQNFDFTNVPSGAVKLDVMYRTPLLYYIVGHAQLRDDENTTDSRAMGFKTLFLKQLVSVA